MVMTALHAGKHVYCEWPLGANLAEADAMAALARAKGVRTMIGLQPMATRSCCVCGNCWQRATWARCSPAPWPCSCLASCREGGTTPGWVSGRTETKTYGSALHPLFQTLVGSLFDSESGPYGEARRYHVMGMCDNFPENKGSTGENMVRKPLKRRKPLSVSFPKRLVLGQVVPHVAAQSLP